MKILTRNRPESSNLPVLFENGYEKPSRFPEKRGRFGEITSAWASGVAGGIRTGFRNLTRTFWPTMPSLAGTKISYNKTRSLYRNDDSKVNLGGGMIRRIINARVDYMDLPNCATGDEVIDEFLDNCIQNFWVSEIQQMIRDACRDADTVIRIRRHSSDNPLVTADEWEACYLEVVPPESVSVFYKQTGDRRQIEKAYVRHEIEEIIQDTDQSGRAITLPQVRQKVIIEEITPNEYNYFDETEGRWRDDLQAPNTWGFVPLVEIHNEYDATLEGGQSDLEGPLPFIFALHDVVAQSLVAHKAHSIPKAKFNVNNVEAFLMSNFPESFDQDENGNPIPNTFNGSVDWKGTEIFFMQSEEDAGFIEAQSSLGDSISLMDFLIGCISISAETPRSILMATKVDDNDEITPFVKLINRKRRFFTEPIQEICKMVLSINLMEPVRVPLDWGELTADEMLKRAQALQNDTMSLEVLATREVISDQTVRAHLRPLIKRMKSSTEEARDARGNKQLPMTSPQSVRGTDSGRNE